MRSEPFGCGSIPNYITRKFLREIKQETSPCWASARMSPASSHIFRQVCAMKTASCSHGFRQILRCRTQRGRAGREERTVRHMQRFPRPLRKIAVSSHGKVLCGPEEHSFGRFQGHRRMQPPFGFRRQIRLSQSRYRPPSSAGIRRHFPSGSAGKMGREISGRHCGHEAEARPREAQDRRQKFRQSGQDSRRRPGAGYDAEAGGRRDQLRFQAQRRRRAGRCRAAFRPFCAHGNAQRRERQVRKEPGAQFL